MYKAGSGVTTQDTLPNDRSQKDAALVNFPIFGAVAFQTLEDLNR